MPTSSHDACSADEPSQGGRLVALENRLRLLLHHLAGRAILARTEIDDLIQEVYLRAVTRTEGLPAYSPGDPSDAELYALLARISRNTVIDIARSIRALKRDGRTMPLVRADWSRVEGAAESHIRSLKPGPATQAAGADEEGQLLAAFRRLGPDHRRVIGLRQFEGKSAAESAQRMGRTETAVHSLYRRALEAWDRATRDKE